jgi:hypothetical protein
VPHHINKKLKKLKKKKKKKQERESWGCQTILLGVVDHPFWPRDGQTKAKYKNK